MGKIIAMCNQKGGVGKTTLTLNIAAVAAEKKKKKVLLVDFDSQMNLTQYVAGAALDKLQYSVADALRETFDEDESESSSSLYKNNYFKNLYFLPGSENLSDVMIELEREYGREYALEKVLDRYRDYFDYIFIDCAPSLQLDLVNALTCADEALIVTTAEPYPYSGVEKLMSTISKIKKRLNPNLKPVGVLVNAVDRRASLTPAIIDKMIEQWSSILPIIGEIPRSIKVSESQTVSVPLSVYAPNNKVTLACEAAFENYLEITKGEK